MDKQTLAFYVRAAQFLSIVVGCVVLSSGLNHYRRLFRLAQAGTPIDAQQLSNFPESLRWYFVTFAAAIIAMGVLERIYRKLRPNTSLERTREG
jgi:hypothetical protein